MAFKMSMQKICHSLTKRKGASLPDKHPVTALSFYLLKDINPAFSLYGNALPPHMKTILPPRKELSQATFWPILNTNFRTLGSGVKDSADRAPPLPGSSACRYGHSPCGVCYINHDHLVHERSCRHTATCSRPAGGYCARPLQVVQGHPPFPSRGGSERSGQIPPCRLSTPEHRGAPLGSRECRTGGLHIAEGVGQDRKALIPPLFIAVIVGKRVCLFHQMPNAPGDEIPIFSK